MVLLAASIITKSGKALITRTFVSDMVTARLQGLLEVFPKLIGNRNDKEARQHTFEETDSVRYVYHPMDNIYMVLITTKASNILEDLETLRLFSRVIPEYCRTNEEKEILSHDFDLIAAFDEIVTLGYRESVNLAQIRTFTEMDSHEERVFMEIKKSQEKAAKEAMALKAKEFKRMQKEALSKGLKPTAGYSASSSISSSTTPLASVQESAPVKNTAPSRSTGGGKALKLGVKTKDEDEFLSQLRQQGQQIAPVERTTARDSMQVAPAPAVKRDPVHVRTEEKLVASVSRDGGLQSAEVLGNVFVSVSSTEFNTVAIQMYNRALEGVQLQVHPNMDKKDWLASSLLRLKSSGKPYPANNDVGVLKWKFVLSDEEQLPLTLNCWPQESSDGCQVNIEYTLQRDDLTLEDVVIVVPLPNGVTPVVSECEGSYEYQKSRHELHWTLPIIDSSNSTGTLEFTVASGHTDNFFPVNVRFRSDKLFVDIGADNATKDGNSVPFSVEKRFITEKFEIV